MTAELRPIGVVRSPLSDAAVAPRQPDEGAPAAWLEIDAAVAAGLEGIAAGDKLLVLTWLDRADRATVRVHPRGDPARPATGVFATRSPGRPNPIGLHRVESRRSTGRGCGWCGWRRSTAPRSST